MSTISLRLPESLHKAARNLAREENISINQLITLALAEKVSALAAEDYIQKRGARANRKKFLSALAKVPHGEPEKNDHLPKGRHRSSVKKS